MGLLLRRLALAMKRPTHPPAPRAFAPGSSLMISTTEALHTFSTMFNYNEEIIEVSLPSRTRGSPLGPSGASAPGCSCAAKCSVAGTNLSSSQNLTPVQLLYTSIRAQDEYEAGIGAGAHRQV